MHHFGGNKTLFGAWNAPYLGRGIGFVRACLLLCVFTLTACTDKKADSVNDLGTWLGGQATEDFARAIKPREFVFPADHLAHPAYRNEWWYITGNVSDKSGHEFGYQVTFFRIGLSGKEVKRSSAWASQHIWMAHIALTDINAGKHLHDQRLMRGAVGLAGVRTRPFTVWLEDWQIVGDDSADFPWQVEVSSDEFALNLTLSPLKPVVLQGENGLSQKSAGAGNASYYYSFTRLQTNGKIRTRSGEYEVEGLSWLDREWSTSVLGDNQEGWDWFSLQLDNGVDVMYYQLRDRSGEADSYSAGKWIDAKGKSTVIKKEDINLKPLKFWRSETGSRYPVEWSFTIPKLNISWRIQAAVNNQEMKTAINYWEGAVRVWDDVTNKVVGKGYLEMTGYLQ